MEEDNKIKNKSIKTYTQDMVKALEGDKVGLIKKIIHEEEQHEAEKRNLSPESKKNKLLILMSSVFVALALVLIIFLTFFYKNNNSVFVTPEASSIIFNDQTDFAVIDGFSKDKIVEAVLNRVKNTKIKIGEVEGIYLTENKKVIDFNRFFTLVEGSLTVDQINSINNNFLLGVVNNTGLVKNDINSFFISKNPHTIVAPITTPEPVSVTPTPVTTIEGKPMTLNSSAFFKTGTAEFIDADAKDKAKVTIGNFLDGVDFSTSKISVVGTYSVERPWIKNDEIAETRRKLGMDILNEILIEKYTPDEISKITIESSARGVSVKDTHTEEETKAMTSSELKDAINSTQGIQYYIQAKTKPEIVPVVVSAVPVADTTNSDTTKIDTTVSSTTDSSSNVTSSLDFFILLKVKSLAEVFPTMVSWESKMFYDLKGFFNINLTPETEYLLTKEWVDDIVVNKNARVLYDDNGKVVLMYVYADDNSVIITNAGNAVREVVLRLNSSKVKK
ncbi:MAG: hypothetical protein WC839_01590 [Candidatus Paceibacterota bacterium]